MNNDDYEKIRREVVFEKVAKAIREDRKNWITQLEDIGFHWVDDGYGDEELVEEEQARPENPNQELLVAYFEGSTQFSEQILAAFLPEKYVEEPNYPLFRKYFRHGNENLKKMILSGLEGNPADIGLLSDLAFFHEFKNILSEMIGYYLMGCEHEKDPRLFEELVLDFYYNTEPDGFDALYELCEKYGPDSEKGMIVREIIQKQKSEPESIDF